MKIYTNILRQQLKYKQSTELISQLLSALQNIKTAQNQLLVSRHLITVY